MIWFHLEEKMLYSPYNFDQPLQGDNCTHRVLITVVGKDVVKLTLHGLELCCHFL